MINTPKGAQKEYPKEGFSEHPEIPQNRAIIPEL